MKGVVELACCSLESFFVFVFDITFSLDALIFTNVTQCCHPLNGEQWKLRDTAC